MSPTRWVECQCFSELHGWLLFPLRSQTKPRPFPQARNQHLLCPGSVDRGATNAQLRSTPVGHNVQLHFYPGLLWNSSNVTRMTQDWWGDLRHGSAWGCELSLLPLQRCSWIEHREKQNQPTQPMDSSFSPENWQSQELIVTVMFREVAFHQSVIFFPRVPTCRETDVSLYYI